MLGLLILRYLYVQVLAKDSNIIGNIILNNRFQILV